MIYVYASCVQIPIPSREHLNLQLNQRPVVYLWYMYVKQVECHFYPNFTNALKMEELCSSEMLVPTFQPLQCHNP